MLNQVSHADRGIDGQPVIGMQVGDTNRQVPGHWSLNSIGWVFRCIHSMGG